jgi:hypothetical protein
MRLEPCLMLANSDGTVSYFDEYKTGRANSTSALELFEKSRAFLLTSATPMLFVLPILLVVSE